MQSTIAAGDVGAVFASTTARMLAVDLQLVKSCEVTQKIDMRCLGI